MLDNLCMISAIVDYHLLKHWNQTMVICHGLSSTSIDTWEDITTIRIIIITYNNALSSSHWNNYHSPNHPSSRVVCVSGASESFNHTAKTINCNGMHTNQLWLSGLANSVVLSWRLKVKLLEGSFNRHCLWIWHWQGSNLLQFYFSSLFQVHFLASNENTSLSFATPSWSSRIISPCKPSAEKPFW